MVCLCTLSPSIPHATTVFLPPTNGMSMYTLVQLMIPLYAYSYDDPFKDTAWSYNSPGNRCNSPPLFRDASVLPFRERFLVYWLCCCAVVVCGCAVVCCCPVVVLLLCAVVLFLRAQPRSERAQGSVRNRDGGLADRQHV